MPEQSKDERAVWAAFMNLPGEHALRLFEEARKILISRNLIKAPRVRKLLKDKSHGNDQTEKL